MCHALSPLPFVAVFAHVRVYAHARASVCASPPYVYTRDHDEQPELVVEAREDRRRETGQLGHSSLYLAGFALYGYQTIVQSRRERASVRACLRTPRDFPGQVTYRRFTTLTLPYAFLFFLSLSLSLCLPSPYHSAPFWKDSAPSRTSRVKGYV